MPEEGVSLSPKHHILTATEIYRLASLFVEQGIKKIRLTGGEPTVRNDFMPLFQRLGTLQQSGLVDLALTTNALTLHRKLDALVEAGLTAVNISLDTLDAQKFKMLTRRNGHSAVRRSLDRAMELKKLGAKLKVKVNVVVMRELNLDEVLPFVDLTREEDLEVRFIEFMPFGGNNWSTKKMVSYLELTDIIRTAHPGFHRLQDERHETSKTWQVPGFVGRIGFITSMTHNFCATCNRLRITADGNLKVCLHGNAEVSLREILRYNSNTRQQQQETLEGAHNLSTDEHMSSEGWALKRQKLLSVVRAAVLRKKFAHGDIPELQESDNRPMILIGG
jgi:GTP 3',8-cyclase